MKIFVFHEFHNSTFNTDVFDTISSHSRGVFVPFYMGKQRTDAYGFRFVTVVQVAPYDVKSIHVSNMGNRGSGIEIAKNKSDKLQSLQAKAGILVATMIKKKAPYLKVVNHRGREGVTQLRAYKDRLSKLRKRPSAPHVVLPFVPAKKARVASATGRLEDILLRPGAKPRVAVARRKTPAKKTPAAKKVTVAAAKVRVPAPTLKPVPVASASMSPLAEYLRANLATMKRLPEFAAIIPDAVAAIGEVSPREGIVYLLDASENVLGHVEAHRRKGTIVKGRYAYVMGADGQEPSAVFDLDLSKPAYMRLASLPSSVTPGESWTLSEPPTPATLPECGDVSDENLVVPCRQRVSSRE